MAAPRPVQAGLFTDGPDGPRLLGARCVECGRTHFPAGPGCPFCGADAPEPTALGPTARLWLHTAVTARPPGYRGPLPYGFGIVELPCGLRIVTRLTESDPTRLRPGQSLRLVLDELARDDDGTPVISYAFAPEVP